MTELIKNNRMVIQIEILEKRKKRIFYILEKKNFALINTIGHDYFFKNF